MRRFAPLLVCLSLASACGLLGDDSPQLRRVRGGGTGPFRSLTQLETELTNPPEGRIATNAGSGLPVWGKHTFGRVAWNDAGCFASRAIAIEPTPVRDPGAVFGEPDPLQFESMHIVACEPANALTMTIGGIVLSPSEPWEGANLRDPFPLRLEDGTIRLYYAADGGIGVAQASEPAGPFVRVGTAPVLAPLDIAKPLRSPSVVIAPSGEYVMYFDDGTDIFLARSDDGLAFTISDANEETPAIDPIVLEPPLEAEISRLHPGAIATTTTSGRPVVRLYFDVSADGDEHICMAGSFDGLTFERFPMSSYKSDTIGYPVPRELPGGETVLTLTRASLTPVITRVPVGAVAPIFASFDAGL